MPKISVENLRDHFKTGDLDPVYLLYGNETYLRTKAAEAIAGKCFADGDLREFNEAEFSLTDPSNIRDALAAADQLPMMASRRLIKVSDVRVAAASVKDTLKEQYEPILADYLSRPSDSTVLIFVADEMNGNRKLTKLFDKYSTVVEFKTLTGTDLLNWIERLFRAENVTPDIDAVRHLASLASSDLVRLSNEIRKLAAASMPEGKVTRELVDELIPRTRLADSFAVTGHLVGGRRREAVASLSQIIDDGAEPLMVLGLLGSNYRRLMIAKDMMEMGRDRRDVASAVKLRYNDQEPFLAAARRIDRTKLLRAIESIGAADLAIKTSIGGGTKGARMQLEMLICELAS